MSAIYAKPCRRKAAPRPESPQSSSKRVDHERQILAFDNQVSKDLWPASRGTEYIWKLPRTETAWLIVQDGQSTILFDFRALLMHVPELSVLNQ